MTSLRTITITLFAVIALCVAVFTSDRLAPALCAGEVKTDLACHALARLGNPSAQFSLGSSYIFESKLPHDPDRAVYWLTKSAEQGHAQAQLSLGWRYRYGEVGIEKDGEKSIHWLTEASEQDCAWAQLSLGYALLEEQKNPQVTELGLYWIAKAAEQGFIDAQSGLGDLYLEGENVPQDFDKAFLWLESAAMQGEEDAEGLLGELYLMGRGTAKDVEKAIYWLRLATDHGNDHAPSLLGQMYFDGEGVEENILLAHMYWRASSYNGNRTAQKVVYALSDEMTRSEKNRANNLFRDWIGVINMRNAQVEDEEEEFDFCAVIRKKPT